MADPRPGGRHADADELLASLSVIGRVFAATGGDRVRCAASTDREAVLLVDRAWPWCAAVGWLVAPFWLAVAIAAQLAIGGIGAVWVIGPARGELGFARYAMLATAGVALTLFGRLVPGLGLLLAPIVAVCCWSA